MVKGNVRNFRGEPYVPGSAFKLAIINQNPADATLADLSITFLGKRT